MKPRRTFDAVVVGAGIVGAACARELALNGLLVALCDANTYVGGGATAAGMGHLAVMDDSEAQFALTAYSQRLWRELSPELPAEAEYLSCGSLWVAADDEEHAEVERKFRFYTGRDLPVEILGGKQLREAEPNLREGLVSALRMPSDSVCYPPCAARYFAKVVTHRGGSLLLGQRAAAINGGELVTEGGERLSTDLIVLAAGTAVTKLVDGLDIQPRKGHLVITDRYPGFLHHQLIELGYLKSAHSTTTDSVAFNAQPRATGQILIGSSRQFSREDPAVEDHMLQKMLARAVHYMPRLAQLSALRTWTGFRAATRDKLPFIGVCPGHERVYLAAGHEGLGISTSLATARLIADHIFHRESSIDRRPYEAARVFAHHA